MSIADYLSPLSFRPISPPSFTLPPPLPLTPPPPLFFFMRSLLLLFPQSSHLPILLSLLFSSPHFPSSSLSSPLLPLKPSASPIQSKDAPPLASWVTLASQKLLDNLPRWRISVQVPMCVSPCLFLAPCPPSPPPPRSSPKWFPDAPTLMDGH